MVVTAKRIAGEVVCVLHVFARDAMGALRPGLCIRPSIL
jgi:hypothetical protein